MSAFEFFEIALFCAIVVWLCILYCTSVQVLLCIWAWAEYHRERLSKLKKEL